MYMPFGKPLALLALGTLVSLSCSVSVYAQCCGGPGGCPSPGRSESCVSYGNGGSTTQLNEPYGGQWFCPVTGEKLGLRQPAVPVQTTIGEKKPSFLGKMFGKKPTPGQVIYVCCPECVAKVQSNPSPYFMELIADNCSFAYTYRSAPAKRPARARADSVPGTEITRTSLNAAQK